MPKSIKTLLQIGYWLLYLLLLLTLIFLQTSFFQKKPDFPGWLRIMTGFAIVPGMIGFYGFYLFLFPRYLKTKKFFQLLVSAVLVSMGAAIVGMAVLAILINTKFLTNDRYAVFIIGGMLTFIAFVNGTIGLIIRGFISWFDDFKIREELHSRNNEMELALIKSRIDPHFLFNTINNIDILIEKESSKASSYLNKLSDIMRFMLYETKTDRIPLTKELDYIEKYIALQKIRTSNAEAIRYAVEGLPANRMIAPMLFIPFIENAFKHTAIKTKNSVCIHLSVLAAEIVFVCENRLEEPVNPDIQHGGLGKPLIEKRLELLYPGKHQLTTTADNQTYKVILTIYA
ncbi:sensor histidine kinase [Dyadobacter bucti]|uniref:sensor histidine kinase n=1 Tax=Dyadobacter bucti TaxID=2572203 RepID=UPI0011081A92|nr:sensor histidine kinase [Dyadobacter bucti]